MPKKKITIIGAGKVGSTAALLAARQELGDIVLLNRTASIAKGIALDIAESLPLDDFDANIVGGGNYHLSKDSDVVVITAGAQRKEGMSREDLLHTNAQIVASITKEAIKQSPHAILIVVTNPLDAMVYVAKKISRLPGHRVFGMAGILDSSRFKSFIAKELKVSVEDVSALVLGGHGDEMIPLPRHASVNGIPLTELLPTKRINELVRHTRDAGAEIIRLEKESSAYISPGNSVVGMIEAIVKDKKRVLPCAAYLNGEYGIKGIFMGVPVRLGAKGVERIFQVRLDAKERQAFSKSAAKIKKLIMQLRI